MYITAGIPQVPDIPIGVSNALGSVVLTLRTAASGRVRPQRFSFIVNFTRTSTIMEGSRVLFASDYVDGERHQFTIDGLMEGESYLFSAQARNQFGSSEFSGISTPITIVTSKSHMCVCVCVPIHSTFYGITLTPGELYHCRW